MADAATDPVRPTRPAGMASRATAVIIDGIVAFIAIGIPVGLVTGQTYDRHGSVGVSLHGWPALLWLGMAFGYWIVCEHLWGATLGKRIFSIHVEGPDGARPTWGQAISRNLWRIVDGFPYVLPYLLGFIVARSGSERRRIGDTRAGTRVLGSA